MTTFVDAGSVSSAAASVTSPTSRRKAVARLLRLAASRSTEGRIGE